MIQQTELINLSEEKKLILLAKFFEDKIMANATIQTLSPAELNNWLSQNSSEILSKLRTQSLSTGLCWKCEKKLSYSTFNEGDNWSIECLNCDILYDED